MNGRYSSPSTIRGAAALAAILALFTPSLGAQSVAALSLEDCLAKGLAANKAIELEAAKTAAAKARLDFMERQYFPSLVASGSYTRSSVIPGGTFTALPKGLPPISITLPSSFPDAWLFRLGMQQPLFTGFRIESGISQAKAALGSAAADSATRRKEAASGIEKAWWGLVLAQESSRAILDSAPSIRAHVGEARARLDKGIGLRSELLSAQKRVADLDAQLSDASSALSLARAHLNIQLGLHWNAPTEALVSDDTADPASLPKLEGLVERAKVSRPELSSAAYRVASAEALERSARSGLLPTVFLTGSIALADPNPKVFPQVEGFDSLWDIGILVNIDLGRIPASLSQAEEAKATTAQARIGLAQANDSITLDVVTAWLDLSRTADRYKSTLSSVALAEDALGSQKDRFAAGLALTTEVADAESALLQAKLDRTRARVAWELARSALRDALGED